MMPLQSPRLGSWRLVLALGLLLVLGGGSFWVMHGQTRQSAVFTPQIIATYPHDANAFVQGLILEGPTAYESTGHYGQSTLREVDWATGKVRRQFALDARYFGEGIAVWKDWIIQLTWREQVALVYEKATFKPIGQFRYQGEGWGLTHDGTHLYMSNGSATIRVRDPQTFREVRTFAVRDQRRLVTNLNELEFVGPELWANVWGADSIVRIDPATGTVLGWVDLSGLPRPNNREAVANGIAYDAAADRLLVTGKNWYSVYEITRPPAGAAKPR